jgi:uncharacterized protein (DUF1501 family)
MTRNRAIRGHRPSGSPGGSTRRDFLAGGLSSLAALPLLPFLGPAHALAAASASRRTDRIVVLVDLAGGNDGLNTVVPHADPLYTRARPTLKLGAADLLPLAPGLGLRRELLPLHRRFEAGELAIVQGVGYPRPDRSHFKSIDIWHTARREPDAAAPGWITRLVDQPAFAASGGTPLLMCGGGGVPRAIVGVRGPAPQVERIEELSPSVGPGDGAAARAAALERLADGGGEAGDALDFLRRTTRAAQQQSAQVARAAARGSVTGDYGLAPIGGALRLAAQLIAGGLDSSAYYVRQDGYDTHAFQAEAHALLLADLGRALGAFQDDLVAAGAAERVVVLCWSEFGRRVAENGSKGTDHGAAAPLFVMGKSVRGGLHGEAPRLDSLVDGDLPHAIDFRRVYSALLEQWFGVAAEPVLGEKFAPLPLIGGAG